MPLPFLGIPVEQVIKAGQLNLLYQYWIHTETIERLSKPVENLFNTPSHHRVHHGVNLQYIDKNYAGIFITWDKIFGTFEPEVRKIKYGLTKNIGTFKPLKIAYHEFTDLFLDVREAKSWREKVSCFFAHPK
jgi:sterol desaturase/sphingolipid hydroxylase (fatty acid hydroxylase superfamily)